MTHTWIFFLHPEENCDFHETYAHSTNLVPNFTQISAVNVENKESNLGPPPPLK